MSSPRRSRPAMLALGVIAAAGVAAAAGASSATAANKLFWSAELSNTISTSDSDGANAADLVTSSDAGGPFGTVVDPAAGKIYWVARDDQTIRYSDLDGSNPGNLDVGSAVVSNPYGLTFDPSTRTLYWANDGGDNIHFAKTDGSGGDELYSGLTQLNDPVSAAVDPSRNKIYWSNYGSGIIGYANLDGTGSPGEITFLGACTSLDYSYAVQVDSARDTLYQMGYANGTSEGIVQKARLDGSGCEDLVTGLVDQTYGGTLDPLLNRLVYADYDSDVMGYVNLTGGSRGTLDISGAGLDGVRYPTLLATPVAATAPIVSPASATSGASLTCSDPTWSVGTPGMQLFRSPSSTSANRYSWTRNGEPLTDTGPTITAAQAGTYQCRVTASNAAGDGQALSNEVTVAEVAAPAPAPALTTTVDNTLTPGKTRVSPTAITSTFTVPGPGTLSQAATTPRAGSNATEMAKKPRTITVCRAQKSVAAAGKVTIICRLNASARAAMKKGPLKVRLVTTFTPTGGTANSVSKRLVLARTVAPKRLAVTG